MKTLTILLSIALLSAVSRAEETSKKPDVVEAAKQAKAKRQTSKTKVLTNADVKKAKSKLIIKDKPAGATVDVAEKQPAVADRNALYHAQADATAQVTESEKKVASLEKDLEAIEHRYYEENDPNYRDNVIQKRFALTKRQLEDARRELADARDALTKIKDGTQP